MKFHSFVSALDAKVDLAQCVTHVSLPDDVTGEIRYYPVAPSDYLSEMVKLRKVVVNQTVPVFPRAEGGHRNG